MASSENRYTIGIDVGGTKVLTALLDAQFRVVSEVKQKTRPEKGERHFMDTLTDTIGAVMKDGNVGRKEILGIGMGCPGFINSRTGFIVSSPNIAFLKNFPLAARLSKETGVDVCVGNDVQTGLYGEFRLGAAKGYSNVVGIFMGTGIGGAIIVNGEPYSGSSGSAGEVGHILFDPEGPLCGCGHYGCYEAYAGRLAIAAEAAITVARGRAPALLQRSGTDLKEIKSGALAKSIEDGDRAIESLLRQKAGLVGLMMANLVNILNPELIVLGGGVVEAMPGLIAREAERVMRERALFSSSRHVKVATAKLKDHSVVMGAGRRAWDRFATAHHPRQ